MKDKIDKVINSVVLIFFAVLGGFMVGMVVATALAEESSTIAYEVSREATHFCYVSKQQPKITLTEHKVDKLVYTITCE